MTRPGSTRRTVALAAVAAAVLALLAGLIVARGGAPLGWDRAIILALRDPVDPARPLGPAWLRPMMVDVTALGDGTILTLAVLVVAGLLLVLGRRRSALTVVAATLSGSILAGEAKLLVGRPRPDLVARLVEVGGLSFPSGHATNSAIVYLTLAGLVTHVERGAAVRRYTLIVAAALVATIGMSRVYLGVHWPSDVVAGWCAGTLWALLWWWIAARMHVGDDRPARSG